VYWIDMPDLAANAGTIQVQRGAGSAFYGPPAIGGSINLQSILSPKQEIKLSGGYGSFNTSKFGLTMSSGLMSDKYILYGRLTKAHTDGYRNFSWLDAYSYNLAFGMFDSIF